MFPAAAKATQAGRPLFDISGHDAIDSDGLSDREREVALAGLVRPKFRVTQKVDAVKGRSSWQWAGGSCCPTCSSPSQLQTSHAQTSKVFLIAFALCSGNGAIVARAAATLPSTVPRLGLT